MSPTMTLADQFEHMGFHATDTGSEQVCQVKNFQCSNTILWKCDAQVVVNLATVVGYAIACSSARTDGALC